MTKLTTKIALSLTSVLLLSVNIYAQDNKDLRVVCDTNFTCSKNGFTKFKDTTDDRDSKAKYWVLANQGSASGKCNGDIPVQQILCPAGEFSIEICDCK